MTRLRKGSLWGLLVLGALAAGCGGSGAGEGEGQGEGQATQGGAGGEAPADAPRVTGAEARAMVANGAFLLDVSPPERAAQSAIEGRTHIPLGELDARMGELPRDRDIVVYCFGGRGSPVAGARLRAAGYRAFVLGAMTNWDL